MQQIMLNADDAKVLEFMKRTPVIERSQGPSDIGLSEAETARSLFRLTHYHPPLINRLGDSTRYQLSAEGRKLLHVEDQPVPQPVNVEASVHIEPAPRGQLVRLLKTKPHSVADLVRLTGLELHQVHYFLKTLEARGLMGVPERSKEDGRVVLYRLKSTPIEPAVPVLTPSIFPLNDPYDWHTWMQRLLIEKHGGPKVVLESSDVFHTVTQQSVRLPSILIVGAPVGSHQRLTSTFATRLRLSFHDDRNSSRVNDFTNRIRFVDKVFLCVLRCRHEIEYVLRANAKDKMVKVYGALSALLYALESYCQ